MTRASRRRFLKLVLTGSVAVVAGGGAPRVRPACAASAAALPASMRREIASQKSYVARSLKVIRDYRLPPGSDMGFVFRPFARPRRPRTR